MTLRADDGTILHAKEATVLDADGNLITEPSSHHRKQYTGQSGGKIHIFRGGGLWFAPLAIAATLTFLALGTFFVSAFFILFLIFLVVRFLLKSFGTKI